jgi:hypothetical protein
MPERDAFEGAYRRLSVTRIAPSLAGAKLPPPLSTDYPAVRWAASRLLPRLTALAPKRQGSLVRPRDD